jgi:choice-of-anchor B domain-containing protein
MRFLLVVLCLFTSPVLHAQLSDKVTLLCNWSDTANIRMTHSGQRYNDVWGFVHNGKEYAALGSTEGVHIIDIDSCRQIAMAYGRDSGANIVHRDYKTYDHYLYAVCDEGESTLQVFDLNALPDSLHLVYESNIFEFSLSHNIFIDTANATLYACSARSLTGSDHMRVYSLANPEEPVLITRYNLHDKVHDVYVRNDTAFCSSSFYGLEVVDFSSHDQNYQNIGELHFYPYQGYNHSSWIRDDGIGVMADETHSLPLKVIDTRNLLDIAVISTFSPRPNDTTCIPHNPYIKGDFVYISYYFDGLQIYDISDPYNPKRAGYYDTNPGVPYKGYNGAWGCYPYLPSGRVLISDMQTGLYVFDVSEAIKKEDTAIAPPETFFATYPNPVTDLFQIAFPKSDIGQVQVVIHDVAGRKLWSRSLELFNYTIQPIQLTLPGYWAPGTYFISIKTGAHFYKEKFTKR